MRRIVFYFLLLSVSVFTFSQESKSNKNPNAPQIVFDKLVHDYGTLKKGANGECEFVFTNKGKSPLILTDVKSSCGCTVPDWPQEPIMPGKKGKIKVKYDTNSIGTFNKQITVFSNAENSSIVLRIKGKVEDAPNETVPVKDVKGAVPINK